MADNFIEFSDLLVLPEGFDQKKAQAAIDELIKATAGEDDEYDDDFNVNYSFDHGGLWLGSDAGNGDPGSSAQLAHCVMKCLDIDGYFLLSYCFHCSKLRIGEFGGGAILVSKHGTKSLDLGQVASQVENAVQETDAILGKVTITI